MDRYIDTDLWTNRHTDTDLWTNRNRPMGRQTQIYGQTDTDLWTDRHTHTHRETYGQIDRHRPMDRRTYIHRPMDRHTCCLNTPSRCHFLMYENNWSDNDIR